VSFKLPVELRRAETTAPGFPDLELLADLDRRDQHLTRDPVAVAFDELAVPQAP
jgi:hypothetical protein